MFHRVADFMRRHQSAPLHTPASPPAPAYVASPADVYYSRRWRWALGIMTVIGIQLIRQRRWGVIAAIGLIVSRIWRYARQHEPASPALTPIHIYDARIPTGFDGFTIGQISDIHLGQPFSDANLR